MVPDVVRERIAFNRDAAPTLAAAIKAPPAADGPTDRFSWFEDGEHLVVIAGQQEIDNRGVDLALAHGIYLAGGRRLTLCLPKGGEASTLQRAAFLKPGLELRVYTHDAGKVQRAKVPSKSVAIKNVTQHLGDAHDAAEEMRRASTPRYLRGASHALQELVTWATSQPELDGGHRKGERNRLCRGQRVLSIRSSGEGLLIRAGIHSSENAGWTTLPPGGALARRQMTNLQARVKKGIEERLVAGGPRNQPDEHWFQSVIRNEPRLVNLEHPVLREVPAWRPLGDYEQWSRSFIDLVGVDGLGDIQIVETKISSNADDLFAFRASTTSCGARRTRRGWRSDSRRRAGSRCRRCNMWWQRSRTARTTSHTEFRAISRCSTSRGGSRS